MWITLGEELFEETCHKRQVPELSDKTVMKFLKFFNS